MAKIELKKASVIEISFEGETYNVSKPTVKQGMLYDAAQKEAKTDIEKLKAILDFLESLGLPEAVSEQLTFEGLEAITEALMPVKKK